MARKSPTRTVQILDIPRITVRIDSEPRTELPWKLDFKHTVFRGTLFIEGEQIGRGGMSRDTPGEAVKDAISSMCGTLYEAARKVDSLRPFYKSGNMRAINDGTSAYHPYWIIDGTHEETT